MPAAAASGRLNVTVGGTAAHNHNSVHVNKSWNRESDDYIPGSAMWINKPYAHVWRTIEDTDNAPRTIIGVKTDTITDANSAGLDHPGMALEFASGSGGTAGTLHGTWSVYGNANVYYGTNNNSGTRLYGGGTNSGDNNDNPPGEPFTAADISIFNGGGESAVNFGYTQLIDGRPLLIARATTNRISSVNLNGSDTLMEAQKYGSNGRWQNIRVSKALSNGSGEPNVGRLYMTAHDADYKGLWFGIAENGTRTPMIIDGGRNENQQPTAAPPRITVNAGALAPVASAGDFSAVDFDGTGPIIAYYDATNDTVRVALGTGNGTGGWNRKYLLPSTGAGSELYRGSGKYISIKVDKDGGIHLAFYYSVKNKVVYYYAASRNNIGSAPNGTTVIAHTVDDVITGGEWTDVSVDDNGNPWIVYSDSFRTGNYDGVRVAYRSSGTTGGINFTGTLKCPVTKADITGWEALTMPAIYKVNKDRLNLEVWPPTLRGSVSLGTRPAGAANANNWAAAVGYASDMFRVGYFYYPAWKGY
jgi:hypothetical protein